MGLGGHSISSELSRNLAVPLSYGATHSFRYGVCCQCFAIETVTNTQRSTDGRSMSVWSNSNDELTIGAENDMLKQKLKDMQAAFDIEKDAADSCMMKTKNNNQIFSN